MKIISILLITMFLVPAVAFSQEHHETITRELPFNSADNMERFYISNLFGSVDVEGYRGDEIIIQLDQTITANSREDLDKGIEKVKLEVVTLDDGYYVYINNGSNYFDMEERKVRYEDCNYDWGDFEYHCEFTIRVPEKIWLYASNVNGGDVSVKNITGDHKVMNVNGSIYIVNVSGKTIAHTVNGDVEVSYKTDPSENCSYETINGDIEVYVSDRISAEVEIETFNGDFYTSFDDIKSLGNRVEKTEKKNNGGVTYKLSSTPVFQVGDGNMKLSFNSFNGNMYLRRN